MRRNCNLELRLETLSASSNSTDYNVNSNPMLDMVRGNTNGKQQSINTFYTGGILTACDVKELQARSIILRASRELEKSNMPPSFGPSSPLLQPSITPLFSDGKFHEEIIATVPSTEKDSVTRGSSLSSLAI